MSIGNELGQRAAQEIEEFRRNGNFVPTNFSLRDGQTWTSVKTNKQTFPHLRLQPYADEVNDYLLSIMICGKICFHHFGMKRRQTLESIENIAKEKTRNIGWYVRTWEIHFRIAQECILVEFSSQEKNFNVSGNGAVVDCHALSFYSYFPVIAQ